ncbi:GroES-like protein, partial [Aspergillus ellipticus CBS 707.79]
IPKVQRAVVTPVVGERLNLQITDNAPVVYPTEEGEVLVRIAWTGICRSDACFSIGPEPGFPSHNHIAGHEGIGRIVRSRDEQWIGKAVATRYMGSTCGECLYCVKGLIESCRAQTSLPKHYNGTFQEYMVAPLKALVMLPDWIFTTPDISPARYTAALCSGSTALNGVRAADPRPGDIVVVIGVCGAIGHLTGMIAKAVFGARVIGVEFPGKKDCFDAVAAEKIYDVFVPVVAGSGEADWEQYLQDLRDACHLLRGSGSEGADAVISTASSVAGFCNLPDLVRDGGSIVCLGYRQLKIQGSLMAGSDSAMRVMEWIRDGTIEPQIREVGLEDVLGCLQGSLDFRNSGKTVVRVAS